MFMPVALVLSFFVLHSSGREASKLLRMIYSSETRSYIHDRV